MPWALLIAQILFWVIRTFFFKDITHEVMEASELIKKVPDPQAREAFAVELMDTVRAYKKEQNKGPLVELLERIRSRNVG